MCSSDLLDNIDHIKTHWVMVTPFISQTSLHFGVNDMEGTMVREKIYHEAGAHTAQAMTLDAILRLIRGAGKIPVERDSLYRVVRTYADGDDPRSELDSVEDAEARFGSYRRLIASGEFRFTQR